jgi:nicotinamide-nucleotide amidase
MPGPPGEMQLMWSRVVSPRLQDKFCNAVIFSKTLKVFGISEARAGELTTKFLLASNPTVGIYAKPDGIHLRITAKATTLDIAQELVSHTANEIENILGEIIWGTDSDVLEGIIAQMFLSRGMSLSTMEAGTGGALANMITNTPDSPKFFKHGAVINQDDLLTENGINNHIILNYGPVSKETACEMALAAKNKYGTSVGIGLIGIVDISESKYNPGSVMIGIANDKGTYTFSKKLPGTRVQIKQWAAISALFELRKILM